MTLSQLLQETSYTNLKQVEVQKLDGTYKRNFRQETPEQVYRRQIIPIAKKYIRDGKKTFGTIGFIEGLRYGNGSYSSTHPTTNP